MYTLYIYYIIYIHIYSILYSYIKFIAACESLILTAGRWRFEKSRPRWRYALTTPIFTHPVESMRCDACC